MKAQFNLISKSASSLAGAIFSAGKELFRVTPARIKKCVAVVTLGCFVFTSVGSQALQAAVDFKALNDTDKERRQTFEDFIIPQSYGRITDAWHPETGGTNKLVVNIQDLHCHPEVQKNISKILSSLDEKYKLKNVYVEGGYGSINTSWLCGIGNRDLKKQILENLVDQGRLTGSEYYSVISSRPDLLKGLEDESVHKANLVRLGKILAKKDIYNAKIKELNKDLEFMKAKYLGAKNLSFNELLEKHRSSEIPADKYYKMLAWYVKKINENPDKYNNILPVSMDNYPNISTFIELNRIAKQMNYRDLTRQMQQYMQFLRSNLPYNTYNSLIEKTDNFKKMDELYIYLARLTKDNNINLDAKFPELKKLFDYTEKSQDINPIKLIDEDKRLVEEIRVGLSRNTSELDVSFLADFYSYFQDFLFNKLSADDYEYFIQRFDKFKSTWGKYTFKNRISNLNDDFKLLNDFYHANCLRNGYFIDNIAELNNSVQSKDVKTPNPEPSTLRTTIPELLKNSEIVVIVTGGFHTEGIKGLLREKKISYVTITPNVTQDTRLSTETYSKLVKDQAAAIEKLKTGQFMGAILNNSLALELASNMSSREMFELAIRAANRAIKQAGPADRVTIVEEIEHNTGAKAAFDANSGVITFDNGAQVKLEENNGVIEAKGIKLVSTVSNAVTEATEELVNVNELEYEVIKGDAYHIFEKILKIASEHYLLFGNGLIYELENDPSLKPLEKIDGIEKEILSRLPDFAQRIIAERERRNIDLNNEVGRSVWLKALLAVDLLREYIVPVAGISGTENNGISTLDTIFNVLNGKEITSATDGAGYTLLLQKSKVNPNAIKVRFRRDSDGAISNLAVLLSVKDGMFDFDALLGLVDFNSGNHPENSSMVNLAGQRLVPQIFDHLSQCLPEGTVTSPISVNNTATLEFIAESCYIKDGKLMYIPEILVDNNVTHKEPDAARDLTVVATKDEEGRNPSKYISVSNILAQTQIGRLMRHAGFTEFYITSPGQRAEELYYFKSIVGSKSAKSGKDIMDTKSIKLTAVKTPAISGGANATDKLFEDTSMLLKEYDKGENSRISGFIPQWNEIVRRLKSSHQRNNPSVTIYGHTRITLTNIEPVLESLINSGMIKPEDKKEAASLLRIVMLLHDIAKPLLKNGENHEEASAIEAAGILAGKYPKDKLDLITKLIKYHAYLGMPNDYEDIIKTFGEFSDKEIPILLAVWLCDVSGRPFVGGRMNTDMQTKKVEAWLNARKGIDAPKNLNYIKNIANNTKVINSATSSFSWLERDKICSKLYDKLGSGLWENNYDKETISALVKDSPLSAGEQTLALGVNIQACIDEALLAAGITQAQELQELAVAVEQAMVSSTKQNAKTDGFNKFSTKLLLSVVDLNEEFEKSELTDVISLEELKQHSAGVCTINEFLEKVSQGQIKGIGPLREITDDAFALNYVEGIEQDGAKGYALGLASVYYDALCLACGMKHYRFLTKAFWKTRSLNKIGPDKWIENQMSFLMDEMKGQNESCVVFVPSSINHYKKERTSNEILWLLRANNRDKIKNIYFVFGTYSAFGKEMLLNSDNSAITIKLSEKFANEIYTEYKSKTDVMINHSAGKNSEVSFIEQALVLSPKQLEKAAGFGDLEQALNAQTGKKVVTYKSNGPAGSMLIGGKAFGFASYNPTSDEYMVSEGFWEHFQTDAERGAVLQHEKNEYDWLKSNPGKTFEDYHDYLKYEVEKANKNIVFFENHNDILPYLKEITKQNKPPLVINFDAHRDFNGAVPALFWINVAKQTLVAQNVITCPRNWDDQSELIAKLIKKAQNADVPIVISFCFDYFSLGHDKPGQSFAGSYHHSIEQVQADINKIKDFLEKNGVHPASVLSSISRPYLYSAKADDKYVRLVEAEIQNQFITRSDTAINEELAVLNRAESLLNSALKDWQFHKTPQISEILSQIIPGIELAENITINHIVNAEAERLQKQLNEASFQKHDIINKFTPLGDWLKTLGIDFNVDRIGDYIFKDQVLAGYEAAYNNFKKNPGRITQKQYAEATRHLLEKMITLRKDVHSVEAGKVRTQCLELLDTVIMTLSNSIDTIEMRDLDLAQALPMIVDEKRGEYEKDNVSINISMGSISSLPVKSNQLIIDRIIDNLIRNSITAFKTDQPGDYLANGRILNVKLSFKNNSAVIEYDDNGPGIPQEFLGKIFKERVTTTDSGEGTHIIAAFVKKMNGTIAAENKTNGTGARFIIAIPFVSQETSNENIDNSKPSNIDIPEKGFFDLYGETTGKTEILRQQGKQRREFLNLFRSMFPAGVKQTVFYPLSRGDISTALEMTNADTFIFADKLPFIYTGSNPDNEDYAAYLNYIRKSGWSETKFNTRNQMGAFDFICCELERVYGVDRSRITVTAEIHAPGSVPTLHEWSADDRNGLMDAYGNINSNRFVIKFPLNGSEKTIIYHNVTLPYEGQTMSPEDEDNFTPPGKRFKGKRAG